MRLMLLLIAAALLVWTVPAMAESFIDDARTPIPEVEFVTVLPAEPVAEIVCPETVPNCDLEARGAGSAD